MKNWRIRTRTTVLGILPMMLTFLFLSGYFISSRLSDFDSQLARRGELIAAQLAPAAEYGVIVGDERFLDSLTTAVMAQADVVFVRIENSTGTSLLVRKKPVPIDPDIRVTEFSSAVMQQDIALDSLDDALTANTRAQSAPKIIGQVHIGLSNQSQQQQQREFLQVALLIVVISLSVSLFIAYRISRSITQPIQQLSLTVKKIKDGAYAAVTAPDMGGELGSLAADIAALNQALQTARATEKTYTDGLLRARAAAEAASHSKSQFLANMSHELRTPMNGALGMLQLLKDTPLSVEQTEYIDTANESTEHLLRVINDILDFSKIEDGKLDLENLWTNAADLMQRCVQNFDNDARRKHLDLRCELQSELATMEINVDSTRLRQILINLLGNAIKFTEHGHVRLQASGVVLNEHRLDLHIQVEDTGIGISDSQQAVIFDAFMQADGSTTRKHGGTGLGLSICHQLVQLMDGEISVQSAPGVGSVFSLNLPLAFRRLSASSGLPTRQNKNQDSENPEAAQASATSAVKPRVLLVEDNQINQHVIRGLLQHIGMQVDCADDGELALEKFGQNPYDLILMDCQMPNMDGLEATRIIREREQNQQRRTPIIALTANAMAGDRERCLGAGMDDYLSKPIAKELLFSTTRKWLQPPPETRS